MNLLPSRRNREEAMFSPFSISNWSGFRTDLDRLADSFFAQALRGMDNPEIPGWTPKLDVKETEKEYLVQVDLPGIDPAAIDISISGGMLKLSGERKEERDSEKGDFHVVERNYGSFCRTLQVPENVDADNIRADSEHGVLMLTLPKIKGGQTRQIKIASKK